MAETGAAPTVSRVRRRLLDLARSFTNPLVPDDYIALINPAWSTRESTATVVQIRHEADDAVTVALRPSFPWPGHKPGQYLRIGAEIDGIRHWRAYTITSDPNHPNGLVSVTVKHVERGKMSPFFADRLREGALLFLGEVEGEFHLPPTTPEKLLMISAGSGITPIMAMVREAARRGDLDDIVHLHGTRTADQFIFGPMLRTLSYTNPGYQLHEQSSADEGRLMAEHLDQRVPDWREREAYMSGPREMIDAFIAHWKAEGLHDRLHVERFQPVIGTGVGDADGALGGTVSFRVTDVEATCGPGVSILVGGEEAGANLPYGCRMGICHTCVGRLRTGTVRDLRSGELTSEEGTTIRTCVNAPEGHVEIEL